MRRSFGLLVFAVLLAAAGGAVLLAGMYERRLAVAQEDMAVLDFDDPQTEYASLENDLGKWSWLTASTVKEIRARRAALQYWQGHYADLAASAATPSSGLNDTERDPALLLLAANATFRSVQRGPRDKPTLLKAMDGVVHAYGEALRAGADSPDASYNYELAVRIRQELANGKRKDLPLALVVDDKDQTNIHGDPGEPPPETKTEQFQIRIPMDPKDFRSSQEQNAGTGTPRKRKG